jgi:hypothetical protein
MNENNNRNNNNNLDNNQETEKVIDKNAGNDENLSCSLKDSDSRKRKWNEDEEK